MPRIELSSLPDDAQTWVFGISPALDERQAAHLLGAVDRFLADWAAHGSPIHAGRDLEQFAREVDFFSVCAEAR